MSIRSRNIKLIIAYDGTSYLGWQKTQTGPSIEETLEKALSRILREPIHLQAASRTDAGVHAEGQTVHFLTEKTVELRKLIHSLNGVLPRDIRIHSAADMPFDFHPTLDCTGKEYIYQICNSPIQLPFYQKTSWHYPYPLNRMWMEQAAGFLIGTHDFSAFCNERHLWTRKTICTLDKIAIEPLADERLKISIRGDHFLNKMVRNLVGTLTYVGCGKLLYEQIPAILLSKDRTQAGMTAPAHGLSLKHVFYPG